MENLEKLIYDLYKKNARQCTNEEIYNALLIYTKNQLFEKGYQDGKKKIYYISAEFLIGKLLSNNLINLGIYDDVAAFLKENGKAIADIEEVEPEPSLGNGGLGRLAACFLDSIATLGLPGEGIGLNYHLGLSYHIPESTSHYSKNGEQNNHTDDKLPVSFFFIFQIFNSFILV
jgi:glycogen phosphorylase